MMDSAIAIYRLTELGYEVRISRSSTEFVMLVVVENKKKIAFNSWAPLLPIALQDALKKVNDFNKQKTKKS
jgi:hypothetical protein